MASLVGLSLVLASCLTGSEMGGGDSGPVAGTTEATPNTVAVNPMGVTSLTEAVFEDVTMSAKTIDDGTIDYGTEVRVKGFYKKITKIGLEAELKVPVEGAEIYILLSNGDKVKTTTGPEGCFFFTLQGDKNDDSEIAKGSKLELSAKKPESEESIKNDLYVPDETPFEVTSCD